MTAKARKPIADRKLAGLEEALAHAKGELTLKTVEHREPAPEIDPKTPVALRSEALMLQAVFALMLRLAVQRTPVVSR